MFDMKNPLSGLRRNKMNGATAMLMQRETDINDTIIEFVALARNGVDINNPSIIHDVIKRNCDFELTDNEYNFIFSEVSRKCR